ncbi:MAG: hypothetical protein M3Q14_04785 [bacterium]|nr:hypothetical protein [bacterium]
MHKLLLIIITSSVLFFSVGLSPATASAQGTGCADKPASFLGLPTWYRYLELDTNCEIVGPMREDDPTKLDWQKASGRVGLAIIEILLRIVGLVAVVYVIYGGFRYITSEGEPENAKSARQTIINGLIGLIISLVATGLVAFAAKLLTS